jgi:hypothetical protein
VVSQWALVAAAMTSPAEELSELRKGNEMPILLSAWEHATSLAAATHPALQIALVFRAEASAWKAFLILFILLR